MDQKRQNKSVLVIDDKEVLGGAWYTKDLWGYSNLEVGCHTLKNKSKGYRVLKEQGVPMEVMQIQPAVADAALVAVAFGTATSAVGTSGCKIEIETLWVSWLHLIRLHQDITGDTG